MEDKQDSRKDPLLSLIRQHAPNAHPTNTSPSQTSYHLMETDTQIVQRILELLDNRLQDLGIASYDVTGTTIEDVFLDLMGKEGSGRGQTSPKEPSDTASLPPQQNHDILSLASGRPVPFFHQALTIFYKRLLIAKRSWLSLLIAMGISIAGSCIPLNFVNETRVDCAKFYSQVYTTPLYLGRFPLDRIIGSGLASQFSGFGDRSIDFVQSPPNLLQTIFKLPLTGVKITDLPSPASWEPFIVNNFANITMGGLSYEASNGSITYAWQGTGFQTMFMGPAMQNLAGNLLYRRAFNASGNPVAGSTAVIDASLEFLPFVTNGNDNTRALKWLFIFVGVMVSPASTSLCKSIN